MSASYTFKWPSGPNEVIVTGTFDNWGKSLPLVKQSDGSFELTVPLSTEGTIFYKYVVDGEWLVSHSQKVGQDNSGIENNVLDASDFVSAESTLSRIPEAGGLAVGAGAAATSHSGVNTTVLPSTEGQQTTLGEPGIFVPKDPEALAAFEEVRDVDPKTLNEPEADTPALTPEEKKKQKKKLKRSQYKARKKLQKAAGTTSSAADDTSGIEQSPTPEPETLDPGVVGAIGAAGLAGAIGAGAVGAVVTAGAGALFADSVAHAFQDSESIPHPTADTKVVHGDPAVIPGSHTDLAHSTPSNVAPETSKNISESVPETETTSDSITVPVGIPSNKDSAPETAPIEKDIPSIPVVAKENNQEPQLEASSEVAEGVPETAEASKEEAVVIPSVIASEQTPIESSTANDEVVPTVEPAITLPIENKELAEPVPLEESKEAVAVPEPIPEPAPVSEPVDTAPVIAQPESKSVPGEAPVEAKEVHAAPVHKSKPAYDSDDEIIIAQGGSSAKEVEAQLAASDINVEEIQPTESEARRLAEEAHIPDPTKPHAKPAAKQAAKPAAKTTTKSGKKEEKKKSGFLSKLKKLFK